MKKSFCIILLMISLLLTSCGNLSNNILSEESNSDETYSQSMPPKNTEIEPIDIDEPIGIPIKAVEYPNCTGVSEYKKLNDKQRTAFDGIAQILIDFANGVDVWKNEYFLEEKIDYGDFRVALSIIQANFGVFDILFADISTMSRSEIGLSVSQNDIDCLTVYYESALPAVYEKYKEISSISDTILSSLKTDGTELQKARAIAEWMCDNVEYMYDRESRMSEYPGSVNTVLTKGEGICDGYARTYDFLCKKAGLETIYIESDSTANPDFWHAWNMIRIDGEWYHIDVTWMDADPIQFMYFMVSDKTMEQNHGKAVYYQILEEQKCVAPAANSDKLCPVYFETCDEALSFISKQKVYPGYYIDILMDNETEKQKFIDLSGKLTAIDENGNDLVFAASGIYGALIGVSCMNP